MRRSKMPVLEKRSGYVTIDPRGEHPRDVKVNSRIVDSSNVTSVAWLVDGETELPYNDPHLMIVRFKGGGTYGYIGVSRQRAVAAAYYASTGKYINDRIKPYFEAVRL
jgi:hypothetical protein